MGGDPAEVGPEGDQEHTNGAMREDNRGDKGVIGFCKERQMTIFGVRITDVMVKSYRDGSTDKNLQKGENFKKIKHLKACLEARQSFTPLVFSADG